jgi:hypothetical protein
LVVLRGFHFHARIVNPRCFQSADEAYGLAWLRQEPAPTVFRWKNVGLPTAKKDDRDASLSDGVRQLEDRFAIQADVKQRSVNVFELAKSEALADTLEWADHAAPSHADDRSHIDRYNTFVLDNQYETIGKFVRIDRHASARAVIQATKRTSGKSRSSEPTHPWLGIVKDGVTILGSVSNQARLQGHRALDGSAATPVALRYAASLERC